MNVSVNAFRSLRISFLRAFVAVADNMDFGDGAQELNETCEVIRYRVSVVERASGSPLFERKRKVGPGSPFFLAGLTPVGKCVYEISNQILGAVDSLNDIVSVPE